MGGSGGERSIGDLKIDNVGSIYLAGETFSTDFPTHNPLQPNNGGNIDIFVTKLISSGGVYTFAFSTYLGGISSDIEVVGPEIDADGTIYLAGSTISTDFPTYDPIQASNAGPGDYDVFVTKLISSSGNYTYSFSTYLGGSDTDSFVGGIDVDKDGSIYLIGETTSNDFPTHNPTQPTRGGNTDAFLTKLISTTGVYTFGFSTYLGGSGWEDIINVGGRKIGMLTVDNDMSIYAAGVTNSANFPTHNPIQSNIGGSDDLFVVKLISASNVYTFELSTYLGGTGTENETRGIIVDKTDSIFLAGTTQSANFPTHEATQSSHGGGQDAFITKLIKSSGVYTIDFSTYLGGLGSDQARMLIADKSGNIYLAGTTTSGNYPTQNPIQADFGGGNLLGAIHL